MHVGLEAFIVFALYYIIMKAVVQFLNIEARRNGWTTAAGVAGLLA